MQEGCQLVVYPGQCPINAGDREEEDEVGGHTLAGAENLLHGMGADSDILEGDGEDAKEDCLDGYARGVQEGPADAERPRPPKAPPKTSCPGDKRVTLRHSTARGATVASAALLRPVKEV